MPTSQGFRGLRVYQLAFKLAMEYHESKRFPSEERYSLTDQIRRTCVLLQLLRSGAFSSCSCSVPLPLSLRNYTYTAA